MPSLRALTVLGLRFTTVLNLVAATLACALPALNGTLLYGRDVTTDPLLLRFHFTVWAFVAAMGVGYGLSVAGVRRGGERGLLAAGGIGKLLAAALWTELFVVGLAKPLILVAVATDGALGLLFLTCLVKDPPALES